MPSFRSPRRDAHQVPGCVKASPWRRSEVARFGRGMPYWAVAASDNAAARERGCGSITRWSATCVWCSAVAKGRSAVVDGGAAFEADREAKGRKEAPAVGAASQWANTDDRQQRESNLRNTGGALDPQLVICRRRGACNPASLSRREGPSMATAESRRGYSRVFAVRLCAPTGSINLSSSTRA